MNNKGFVTLSFVLALPLILTLFLAGFWILWSLNQKHKLDNICHFYLLQAQTHLIKGNQLVLQKNLQARSLFLQKKSLEFIIATAPPQIKIPARIQRRVVIAQQKKLRGVQQSYFLMGQQLASKKLFEFRLHFKKTMNQWKTLWKSKKNLHYEINIYFKGSQLKKKLYDIAPTYYRVSRHEDLQSIKAEWHISIAKMLPEWILNFVPVQNIWHGQCYAHPHKGGKKWISNIGRGNHF